MSSKDGNNTEKQVGKKEQEILEIEKKIDNTKPVKDEKKDNPKKEKKSDKKNNSQSNKKTKNKNLWILIVVLVVLLLLLMTSTVFALFNLGKETIAKGVSIDGIDVSNLTIEEATNKINEAVNVELLLGIDLVYGDDYSFDFDISQIQYTYDVSSAVKEAYNIGKSENIVQNNYNLLVAVFGGKDIEMEATYNEESLDGIIENISATIPGLVVQSSYYIEGSELIINSGEAGIEVKKEELKNAILENIENRNALEIIENSEEPVIEIAVEEVEPDAIDIDKIYEEVYKEPQDAYYIEDPFQIFADQNGIDFAISLEEARALIDGNSEEYVIPLTITPASKTIDDIGTEAFPYLVSSYTTKYDASNTDRSENLKIAAEKINGTVLMPGEEFSFNEVVGKRTIEDGYKNAKIYENGQVVDGLAGGICQISSTLYNAVLLANLEVTERRNHSYTTSYVAAGRDATVVYGTQDFKFVNTRTYPIKIEANVANGIVEFAIHGIKEDIEYEIKIIPVTTQTIPYETVYVADGTLAAGQQVVTQSGHSGCKVTTYIEKRLNGVVVSKDVLSNDTYKAMSTIINVGQ